MTEVMTKEEMGKLMQKPCPACGADKMYCQCCGTEEARVAGSKMCPMHTDSMVRDCCMKDMEGMM